MENRRYSGNFFGCGCRNGHPVSGLSMVWWIQKRAPAQSPAICLAIDIRMMLPISSLGFIRLWKIHLPDSKPVPAAHAVCTMFRH
jgi:hypothetical protein